MTSERSRYGLFVSALGALVMTVSVYLPWYAASAGTSGAALSRHADQLTGQQAIGGLAVVLLVLAGLALLDALFPIARHASVVPAGAGGAVVVLGVLATACIVYRMVQLPDPLGVPFALSLREGAWTALLGSLMISLGGLWPRSLPGIAPGESLGPDVWAALTGWTPGA
ncbi:MAG TPA: hypothetical protein VN618_02915 [Solirubrobacteraceae bacterium]|nr:hypothetical protein [Solirubrobacteraceae bacterium]